MVDCIIRYCDRLAITSGCVKLMYLAVKEAAQNKTYYIVITIRRVKAFIFKSTISGAIFRKLEGIKFIFSKRNYFFLRLK